MVVTHLSPLELKRKWGSSSSKELHDVSMQDPVTLDVNAYNIHLQSCWKRVRKDSFMSMPWDLRMKRPDEVFASTGFQMQAEGQMPPLPVVSSETVIRHASTDDSVYKSAGLKFAKNTDERLWREKLSWERKCAYKKWSVLILEDVGAWEIGRQVGKQGNSNIAC